MRAWILCACAIIAAGLDADAAVANEAGPRGPAGDGAANTTSGDGTWRSYAEERLVRGRAEVARWWPDGSSASTPAPSATPSPGFLGWTCDSFLASVFNLIGWAICGAHWPGVKTVTSRLAGMVALVIVMTAFHLVFASCWPLLAGFGWVLTVLLSLLRWVATFGQRRAMRRSGKTCSLDLFGPDVARPPETALLRRAKSASEVARVVLVSGGEVAEVLVDPVRSEGINRHRMILGIACVRQATGRRFRKALQTAEKVHLCRVAGCTEGNMLHVGCFGVLATGDEVDVHEVLDRGV